MVLSFVSSTLVAQDCALVEHGDDWDYRFGIAVDQSDQEAVHSLILNPTVRIAQATFTSERGARIETLTDTHAIYPTTPQQFEHALRNDSRLPLFVPNLQSHEVVCTFGDRIVRQHQRVGFDFLWFQIQNDYTIDVQYVDAGPNVYSSRWTLVRSLDGSMTYDYGSWYFAAITVDGKPMTYVRHFARIGLTTPVPGARIVITGRLEGEVTALLSAFYVETQRDVPTNESNPTD